ncbi:hypothetical protein ABZ401_06295 [Streptomyces sp. NPDC005892]|uniref:hypothetical protein n=1 Tax=Streptomyces sp. NPDC005892 TaxID=3155593 RepID=UPI0033DA3B20
MTFGSSTNDERIDGAADARRTNDTDRTAGTDDTARSAAPAAGTSDRTRTAPAGESAAGAKSVPAPRTAGTASSAGTKTAPGKPAGAETAPADGSPAHRLGRDLATDRAERTDDTERADRTATPHAADASNATDAAHTDRGDRTGTADADRTVSSGALGAKAGTERDGTAATGTRRETAGTSAAGTNGRGHDGALLAGTDREELERRMRDAVSDFVEDPQRAVREAGATLDAVTENLVKALSERSSALRSAEGPESAGERGGERTEQLRIVLQRYRDLTDRLLKV